MSLFTKKQWFVFDESKKISGKYLQPVDTFVINTKNQTHNTNICFRPFFFFKANVPKLKGSRSLKLLFVFILLLRQGNTVVIRVPGFTVYRLLGEASENVETMITGLLKFSTVAQKE